MTKYYKAIKNYIHNTLNLTKKDLSLSQEEIREIITKTIQDEVRKTFFNDKEYIEDTIKQIITNELSREMSPNNCWHTIHDMTSIIKDDINTQICQLVKDNIEIKLKEDKYNGK